MLWAFFYNVLIEINLTDCLVVRYHGINGYYENILNDMAGDEAFFGVAFLCVYAR